VANAANRDFRIDQTGSSWEPTVLEPADTAGLRYVTKLEPPAKGWRASLVVATFDAGPQSPTPLTVSTRVFITPDTLPHAAAVPVPKPE
jgi:PhoPQ-activated pathogenicity-related protein